MLYISLVVQIAHDKEIKSLEASLADYSLKCQELSESKSNVEKSLLETSEQLNSEIKSLETKLLDTSSKLEAAQVTYV